MPRTAAAKTRVSYTLKDVDVGADSRHTSGIQALALDLGDYGATRTTANGNGNIMSPGGILYSGGRDAIVHSWDLHFGSTHAWRNDRQSIAGSYTSSIHEPFHYHANRQLESHPGMSSRKRASSGFTSMLAIKSEFGDDASSRHIDADYDNENYDNVSQISPNGHPSALSNAHHPLSHDPEEDEAGLLLSNGMGGETDSVRGVASPLASSPPRSILQPPHYTHNNNHHVGSPSSGHRLGPHGSFHDLDGNSAALSASAGRRAGEDNLLRKARSVSFSTASVPTAAGGRHRHQKSTSSIDLDAIGGFGRRKMHHRLPPSTHRRKFEYHTDWVNDLALCNRGHHPSSDRSIYLWSTVDNVRPSRVGQHRDYVKCLAYPAAHGGWVASGGLDRRISLWDLAEGRGERSGLLCREMDVIMDDPLCNSSVYALVCNPTGSLLVSGHPDKAVRVWDPRAGGKRMMRLSGHTDNIRALLISDDGRWIVAIDDVCLWTATRSSSINRWRDVPLHTATTYAHPSTENFYSHHHHSASHADLENIHIPPSAIIRAAPTVLDDAASLRSYRFSLASGDTAPSFAGALSDAVVGGSGALGGIVGEEDDEGEGVIEPVWKEPDGVTEGGPGITKVAILNDRRHCVTCNSAGRVSIWDLIKCVKVRDYDVGETFESVVEKAQTKEWVANWCVVQARGAALTVHLEEGRCWDAEVYHEDTGSEVLPSNEDQRVNLAKWVLTYLFLPMTEAHFRSLRACVPRTPQTPTPVPAASSESAPSTPPPVTITLPRRDDSRSPPAMLSPAISEVPSGFFETPPPGEFPAVGGVPRFGFDKGAQDPPPPVPVVAKRGSTKGDVSDDGSDEGSSSNWSDSGDEQGGNGGEVDGRVQNDREDNSANDDNRPNDDRPADDRPSAGMPATSGEKVPPEKFAASAPVVPPQPPDTEIPPQPTDAVRKSVSSEPTLRPKPLLQPNDPTLSTLELTQNRSRSSLDKLGGSPVSSLMDKFMSHVRKRTVSANAEEGKKGNANGSKPEEVEPKNEPAKQKEGEGLQGEEVRGEGVRGDDEESRFLVTLNYDETPPLIVPMDTIVTFAVEESSEVAAFCDLYRGTVGGMGDDRELERVKATIPVWVFEWIVENKSPPRDPAKMSFILQPHTGSDLQELPNGNNRLSANRMLRIRKLLAYVAEKLNIAIPAELAGQDSQMHRVVEILCMDKVVPPKTTLSTLKQHYWKSGGDLVLTYRKAESTGGKSA
ncbi:hypothetical protein HK104_003757 [Borealophlyctis nickersoniae]|nr:hypothetical protein HK104_003757 [Borealophlyctis nickersoniae]